MKQLWHDVDTLTFCADIKNWTANEIDLFLYYFYQFKVANYICKHFINFHVDVLCGTFPMPFFWKNWNCRFSFEFCSSEKAYYLFSCAMLEPKMDYFFNFNKFFLTLSCWGRKIGYLERTPEVWVDFDFTSKIVKSNF
jgi:hypothetical protein